MRVETSMKNYVVGWERAKALACFSEAELQKLDLSSFVEPTRRISMHPNFDSDKYWSMFIDNQRSKISTKDCINKYDKLFPGFELNKKLYFNITGKANVFLADGWSGAESLGIWSESGRANLLIPLRYDYDSIDLEVSALVNKNYPIQHFDVYLNGELIRIIELDKASDNLIKLNKINKDIDKLGLLSFMFRDAISPFDLGLSDDNRTLAIGLVSIKFNKQ